MKRIVRLQRIELNHFKNVNKGVIQFVCNTDKDIFRLQADLLGVYGQNGSGKTTLIYVLNLMKNMLSGKELPEDCAEYITYGKEVAGANIEFSVFLDQNTYYRVIYEFELRKRITNAEKLTLQDLEEDYDSISNEHLSEESLEKDIYLAMEKLSVSKMVDSKWTKMTPILYYSVDDYAVLLPKVRYVQLTMGDKQIEDELRVNKLLIEKSAKSFLFSRTLGSYIYKSNMDQDYKNIFLILREYAVYDLHVITNMETGIINANIALPISFMLRVRDRMALLKGKLNLNGISYLPVMYFDAIQTKMTTINMVLKEIIPGLTIHLQELGTRIDQDYDEIVSAEIMATRENSEIPLRYESDGIKKLVSVLYALIMVFNNPSTTLAVDEFDSGIFEYLLGEIIDVVSEYGKGQLIFTSHNLRPLEVLDKKNIIFTTTNKENRYIRFKNVKADQNFRDVYFHDLILGGQSECIYEAASPYRIRRAFRLAGEEDAK